MWLNINHITGHNNVFYLKKLSFTKTYNFTLPLEWYSFKPSKTKTSKSNENVLTASSLVQVGQAWA